MKLDLRRAQTMVEYLLLISVLLLVFLAAISSPQGALRQGLERYVDRLGDTVGGIIE